MTENFRAPIKIRVALYGFLILAIFVPFIMGVADGDHWARVLDFVLLYVVLALGLNTVVGFAGLLNLGYITFYTAGAYVMVLLGSPHLSNQFERIHNLFPNGLHLIIWWVVPLEAGLAALFDTLLGTLVLKLRGDYLATMTLGFGGIIRTFMSNLGHPVNITNGPRGINLIESIKIFKSGFSKRHDFFGIRLSSAYMYYYLFMILVTIVVIVCLRLQNPRIGYAWVALREDEIAAKVMGVNTYNIRLLASAVDASFGGVSSAMFASLQDLVSPESPMLWESICILAIVVLGGTGHIPNVVLGGILLIGFQELLYVLAEPVQSKLLGHMTVEAKVPYQLLFGLAMVVMVLYRLSGLRSSPCKGDRPQKQRAGGLSRI